MDETVSRQPPAWAVKTKADKRAIEEGCYWDDEQANRIIRFTEKLFRSQFIPGPLVLREEQRRILQSLYGWRLPDGRRRFRFANIHCPKKLLGKTLIVSVICFYELIASGEPSPFVVSGAASTANAAQVYAEVAHAIQSGPFAPFCQQIEYQKRLRIKALGAEFRSVSSDGDRVHGLNCSAVVLDELHAHKNSSLYDSLRWATAARPNGLLVLISTAGRDQNHFYYRQVYDKSKRILSGEDDDITHYAAVWEADQDGNPEDEAQWRKANPLLGEPWADIEQFRRDCLSAKAAGIGEWLNFRRLRLNQWVRADELAWLNVSEWDKLKSDPTEDELRNADSAIGLDLSETTDPSSCSICFALADGRFYFRSWAWVCEAGVKKREGENLRRYEEFRAENTLTFTSGDMIDKRLIQDHVMDLCRRYNVRKVNFDPRGAYVLAYEIEDCGYCCERVPPNARHFNGPMREFERAYTERRITHNGSQWLKYCLSNVRVEVNRYEEIFPVRASSAGKIDGAVSSLLAFMGVLRVPTRSVIIWN